MRHMGGERRQRAYVQAAAVIFSLSAGYQTVGADTPSKEDADELLVVDCLLPGQVRKLGQNMTFLTARRPAKLPARQCEIRGGEYTSYDRADFGTALKVWLAQADEGDPEAQTYVGEIYEKGLGIQPDYALAAQWYLKAAEQGYSRAAINLGHLYEQGLGVRKDLVTALNWYRKASGMTGGDLEFVSSVEVSSREQQIDQLRTALDEQTQETVALRSQLDSTKRALDARMAQLATSQRELTTLRDKAQQRQQTVSSQSVLPNVESTDEYQGLLAQLESARAEHERLKAQAEQRKGEAELLQAWLGETRAQLDAQRAALESTQTELDTMRNELAKRQSEAQTAANRTEIARLKRELEGRELSLAQQRQKMSWRERELVEKGLSLSDELRTAREKERELTGALVERDTKLATLDTELVALQSKLLDQTTLSQQQKSIVAERNRLASELETARQAQRQLLADAARHRDDAEQLRQQLDATRIRLDQQRLALSTAQKERDRVNNELARRQSAEQTEANQEEIAHLKRDLKDRETKLEKQRQQTLHLDRELRSQTNRLDDELRAARAKEQALLGELSDRETEVALMQSELAGLQTELLEQRAISDKQKSAIAERDRLTRELQSALLEQQQLLVEVSRQRGEAQALQSQITSTKTQLNQRQRAVEQAQREVASLKEELGEQRRTSSLQSGRNADKIAELQRLLDTREDALKFEHEEVEWLSNEILVQRTALNQALTATNEKLVNLEDELSKRDKRVQGLHSKLAGLQVELQAERAAGAQSDAELERLNEEIRLREQEIARQENEISELQATVAQETDELVAEPAVVLAASGTAPTIELIEPPLTVTRGVPSIQLRSDVKELEIIGRVKAPGGLVAFRVNDRDHDVENAKGIFKVKVSLRSAETPIHLVAVDNNGDRTVLDFELLSDLAGTAPAQAQAHKTRPAVPSLDIFGNYYALIVGNNRYAHLPDLKTARTDAQELARVLEGKYGFKTTVLLDASRYDLLSALNGFREQLDENDNLLIYYAGHGELDKRNLRAYWLPADAESGSTANWVSNIEITDILNVMTAKHVLVVADSCYSGALTRTALARLQTGMTDEAQLEWYEVMAKTRSRIALTSGGLKPVLDAGGGRHSIFAKAFLDVLNENNGIMESYELYRAVSDRVATAGVKLGIEQEPQFAPIKYAGHEAGEFFFSPKRLARLLDSRMLQLAKPSFWSLFLGADAIAPAPG